MVWRLFVAPMLALLVAMPMLAHEAAAQRRDGWGPDRGPRGDWVLLGSKRIGGFGVDRDTIEIGRDEGPFTRIGVMARESGFFLYEVQIVFGNNETQTYKFRRFLAAGERTPPFDLKGQDRRIKRITIAARHGRDVRNRPYVDVYGEVVGTPWEVLGRKTVSRSVDKDTIRVGRREGRFEKIAFEVTNGDVEIKDIKVFFDRGPPQDVKVRQVISEGGRTRAIDLRGDDRIIDRIEMVYRTRRNSSGQAVVTAVGLPSDKRRGPPPPPPRRWEELGCQKVGFGSDHDVIKVGRQEGRFSAIRLRVDRADVLLIKLKVVYERGPSDDFDVKKRIPAGSDTPPLDLRGERRAIKRVELVYSSIPNFQGSAVVCVDGRN